MTSIPRPYYEQRWPEGEYRLFQFGYVVDDLLGEAANWARVYGIGPFHVFPRIESRCTYRGTESALDMQIAVAQAGPLQIELIQQYCDRASIYRDLIAKGTSGFHQLCTLAPDYEAKKAHFVGLGYDLVCEFFVRGQHVGYFDTLEDFGFFTEIVEEVPGFLEGLTRIAQACAE